MLADITSPTGWPISVNHHAKRVVSYALCIVNNIWTTLFCTLDHTLLRVSLCTPTIQASWPMEVRTLPLSCQYLLAHAWTQAHSLTKPWRKRQLAFKTSAAPSICRTITPKHSSQNSQNSHRNLAKLPSNTPISLLLYKLLPITLPSLFFISALCRVFATFAPAINH